MPCRGIIARLQTSFTRARTNRAPSIFAHTRTETNNPNTRHRASWHINARAEIIDLSNRVYIYILYNSICVCVHSFSQRSRKQSPTGQHTHIIIITYSARTSVICAQINQIDPPVAPHRHRSTKQTPNQTNPATSQQPIIINTHRRHCSHTCTHANVHPHVVHINGGRHSRSTITIYACSACVLVSAAPPQTNTTNTHTRTSTTIARRNDLILCAKQTIKISPFYTKSAAPPAQQTQQFASRRCRRRRHCRRRHRRILS